MMTSCLTRTQAVFPIWNPLFPDSRTIPLAPRRTPTGDRTTGDRRTLFCRTIRFQEEEDFLSEQTLHDETQHATDVPTLEEAVVHTELGEMPTGDRNDQAGLGGSPLSQFDPEDLEH